MFPISWRYAFEFHTKMFLNINQKSYQCVRRLNRRTVSTKSHKIILLSELLDVDKSTVTRLLSKNYYFKTIAEDDIKNSFSILTNFGFSKSYICSNLNLLTIPGGKLKNCLAFFEECGCYFEKIGPATISFRRHLNVRISLLKSYGVLPDDENVSHNFLQCLNLPTDGRMVEETGSETLRQIYLKVYTYYVARELNLDQDGLENFLAKSNTFRCTSLRIVQHNMNIMKNVIGVDTIKLRKYSFLLHVEPENVLSIIKTCRQIDTKNMIRKYPEIVKVSSENFVKTYQYLSMYGVSNYSIQHDPWVFRLPSTTLQYRMSKFLQCPVFRIFITQPRGLILLGHSKTAYERLFILKKANMKCVTLNSLTNPLSSFIRHVTIGIDKVCSQDLCRFVSIELKRPISDVKYELKKNPYLNYIPITQIKETLDFLRSCGFTDDEIYSSVQILLYPINAILKAFDEIETEIFRAPVTKKPNLAVVLYFIEKKHHFSGSGVWSKYIKFHSDESSENAE